MDNERNNETQELMQPPRSLRILHYVDVVVGIGLIILGYFYISNAGLMYYRCQNGITEDYMQEYVKFYQAELKSIETYLYLGDTENYPQYCYKPKANKYLQRNFELSKISGETEKEIDRLLAINDDEIVRVVRFDGWQNSTVGEREVKRELRKVLWTKYQIKDEDLFNRAYDYIKEYY